MIGILGEIPFKVSFDGKNKKILNFTNLKLSGGANYGKHNRRGMKPALEFIDLNTDTVNINITLRSDFGVDPLKMEKKINLYKNSGEVLNFTIGNKKLSGGKFVITSCDFGYEYITNNGTIRKIDASLTLEEYSDIISTDIKTITKIKKSTQKKVVHKDFNQGAIEV